MRILIAGGSGFIGQELINHLAAQQHECVILSRQEQPELRHVLANQAVTTLTWNGYEGGTWQEQLDEIDVVINLTGRSVDCAKTATNCDAILRSRVDSTTCLRTICSQLAKPPKVWLQMSTAHIYGDPASQVVDEDASHGYGLAPTVGKAWEAACYDNPIRGCRDIIMRTSFVLGRTGGAFPTLVWLTRLGLGGRIGSGTQGISWIHIDYFCKLCLTAIADKTMMGIYNFTAPEPVSQLAFMRAIRRCNKHFFGLPSPEFLVRIGSWFMGRDPQLAIAGRYCVSKRLTGKRFAFPTIDQAISDLKPGFFYGWC